MTEEDMKYRQGRSEEKVRSTEKAAIVSYIGLLIILVLSLFFR